MTTFTAHDYFFIRAIPTSIWSQILQYCQVQPIGPGELSAYALDAQTRLTIDVKPSRLSLLSMNAQLLSGTFFSERFHQHTCRDIVQAVRDGSLDPKVLTYPELLSGQDSMVVFFWPDEEGVERKSTGPDMHLYRKSDKLFTELMGQVAQGW